MKLARKLWLILSCVVLNCGLSVSHSYGAAELPALIEDLKISGQSSDDLYLTEEEELILLGNAAVEFAFDKAKGGSLVAMKLKNSPSTSFTFPEQSVKGEWSVEMEGAAPRPVSLSRYDGGEASFEGDEVTLRLESSAPEGRLIHIYHLRKGGADLKTQAEFEKTSQGDGLLKNLRFTLGNLAIGESLDHNEYIYPPTWLHYMRGDIREATDGEMNARYIYGWSQPTDKMMLPYAMIRNKESGHSVALSAVDSRCKVFVGALGGEAGTLECRFEIFRNLAAGAKSDSGTAYLSLRQGSWEQSMQAEKNMLIQEAGFRAPKGLPTFAKDLVIVWHGIPGIDIHTYDDLGRRFQTLRDAGVNAVIVGGKLWYCPASDHGAGTIFDYIPLPQNGDIVPASDVGGLEGFKRLIDTAHDLDMKLFTWGPVSMAGISRESQEAKSEPDWWIYQKDGSFNDWYKFMVPANPHSEGWRKFVVKNVRKIVAEYGVDGFWLDSSWQDHQLNYQAVDGWYGGPNGDKLSLIDEIIETAKKANPECLVMAEVSGAEAMSRVDVAYLQVHGVWPVVPPEGIQEMLVAQEINRLPGVRPFGQIELGTGFYPELPDKTAQRLAKEYSDSWIAKTFLVSTLDRIPVYFGLSWGIDMLSLPETTSAEDNPDLRKARAEREKFQAWFDMLKRVNKVRSEHPEVKNGETVFGELTVSSPSIVHYIRKDDANAAIVLLNAEKSSQPVTVRLTQTSSLKVQPEKDYSMINLMNGKEIAQENGSSTWTGADLCASGFSLLLAGYEGAIIKIVEK